MKVMKSLMYVLGFLPAIFYTAIVLIFLFNSTPIMSLIPTFLATIGLYIAPIFLKREKQTWIGMLAVIIIAALFFIEASLPNAFSPSTYYTVGIIVIFFYALYYYIMQKEVI